MEQWRKDMNARLGMARAEAAAGNQAAANNYFAAAQNIANINSPQTADVVRSQGPPQVLVGPVAGGAIDQMRINGGGSTNISGGDVGGGGGSVGGGGGSGGGGGYTPPAPPPTPPNPWITARTFVPPAGVKQADPDIVLDPEIDTTGDYIVERFFEELGGTELISLSRHDLIDGIDVVYQPIANLSRLRQRFNPNNIIALDILSQDEFARASIDLITRGIYEPYFDDSGNLIVEIDIIRPEENIDVQISESGTVTRIEL